MVVGKNGKVYEFTTVTSDGHIIHHHGTKELTQEQNNIFSRLMSRTWDNLTDEKRKEINERLFP